MGVVLDTSILVAAERRALRFEALLESLGDEPVAISAVTASELLHGCHRASDAGVRTRRSAFVEALLDALPILPFGLAEARLHAQIWAELARRGTMIGPHDLLIAASAMARGYLVASLNQRDFARVAGLRLVDVEPFVQ
jgi:tRNA(fMet)-specific endonuclease VapC